ncbi:MAG TPA: hypothetical protein VFR58_03105 [Flavisolibacter sp.]|nr:hypothetical protein [Flavisolibacter sp.]
MKNLLFFLLFAFNQSFAQDIDLRMLEKTDKLFLLKVFNNSSKPIGIKCTIFYFKFSEQDTFRTAIGDWYNGNGIDYFYDLERSVQESRISESLPYYQLLIINPQSYSMTNVHLSDLEENRGKNIYFQVSYTFELTAEEIVKLSGRRNVVAINEKKDCLSKTIKL